MSAFTLADLRAIASDFEYNPEGNCQYVLLCGQMACGTLWVAWRKLTRDSREPTQPLTPRAERLLGAAEHNEDGVVRAIEFCLRALEEHERGEWLKYKGVRISDPHLTVAQRIRAASEAARP